MDLKYQWTQASNLKTKKMSGHYSYTYVACKKPWFVLQYCILIHYERQMPKVERGGSIAAVF